MTYNPEVGGLHENMAAIGAQLKRLLVFDNGSGNSDMLEHAFSAVGVAIRNTENPRIAKVLNRLVRAAEVGGVTDIVFIGQDSAVGKGLVSEEVRHRAEDVGLDCCLAVDCNVQRSKVDFDAVIELKRLVTSGSVVNISAWKFVGGYDERLFLDRVDNEICGYFYVHGYRIVRTYAVKLLHEMGYEESVWSTSPKGYISSCGSSGVIDDRNARPGAGVARHNCRPSPCASMDRAA